MGTDGLALATLIVIFFANTGKIFFVKRKFSITPFTNKSFLMIFIIAALYLIFNFWDFPIENIYVFKFPIHPIINIILKSILIAGIYITLVIKLNISNEINNIVKRFYK
jgi:hypothetical protein